MNLTEELLRELQSPLCESFECFGAEVTSEVQGLRARVESSLTSRFYGLFVLLTFVNVDDPETELAAVSIEWRKGDAGAWEIDATGRGSRVLAEYAAGTDGAPTIDMTSSSVALRGIESIIGGWKDIVLNELRG